MLAGDSQYLKKELDERWRQSQPLWQQWWYEADLDTKMATGQQDYWSSFYNTNYRNQKVLMFNKILRILNMIGGYQRRNRLASIVTSLHEQEDQVADDATELLAWCHQLDDTYENISNCFDGSNIQGLNLLNIWMDHREDPENGKICSYRLPYNSFIMDNYWTNPDMSDCDFIWTRRYLSRAQILSLFPKLKKDLPAFNKGYGAKDGRFQFLAQNWYQYQQELYAYDEYWTRDYRKVKRVLDRATGEVVDWPGTRDQFDMLRRNNPNVEIISTVKPTVKMHILVNGYAVYEERQPYGIDRYPFVPFMAYHFPEVQNYGYRYQGIVRNIRDSQIELNRRRNRMLDILDSQVQSGLMVKEDALVNPEDAFKQGPGQVQFFKQSSNLATDVVPIPPPQVPQSLFELNKELENDIMNQAGVNEELFGETDGKGDISGFLHQLRMGAGLTSLQTIFDRLNHSQKMVSEIFLEMAIANFSEGHVLQILQRQPDPQLFSPLLQKYKVVIEEGQLTTSQKQTQFVQALQMKQMGIEIPNTYLLKKSNLHGKAELIKTMQQQEQQNAQMQQALAMQQMQQNAIMAKQIESQTISNIASAREKETRAISNIGLSRERSAMAVADQARATMDNVKAIKEIEQLDEDRLYKLANYLIDLQKREKELNDDSTAENASDAELVSST